MQRKLIHQKLKHRPIVFKYTLKKVTDHFVLAPLITILLLCLHCSKKSTANFPFRQSVGVKISKIFCPLNPNHAGSVVDIIRI